MRIAVLGLISALIAFSFNNCDSYNSTKQVKSSLDSSSESLPVAEGSGSELASDVFLDFQGTPRTGKWPGDTPDIGAYEWIPIQLQDSEGRWNGKVLNCNPELNQCP